ncbi:MAG TPA: class I SAM-dependent methyltransferase [Candidatus Faecousia intestinigallinarum]|nr:class I SAM-dependent methyltransferase [Candidatus Faecousia intestinigallinarum]
MRFSILSFLPTKHRLQVVSASLLERLQGLDFTMPDRMYDRGRNDGAMYLASSRKMARQLFSLVDKTRFPNFLDVGCGKGFILWQAQEAGFSKVTGVEYDEKLAQICRGNLQRLNLQDAVTVAQGDAREFPDYGEYDVFYFFNPFVEEVMEQVVSKIIRQCAGKEIVIIYYRPRYPAPIEKSGYFHLEYVLRDRDRNYDIHVYRGNIPEKEGIDISQECAMIQKNCIQALSRVVEGTA